MAIVSAAFYATAPRRWLCAAGGAAVATHTTPTGNRRRARQGLGDHRLPVDAPEGAVQGLGLGHGEGGAGVGTSAPFLLVRHGLRV